MLQLITLMAAIAVSAEEAKDKPTDEQLDSYVADVSKDADNRGGNFRRGPLKVGLVGGVLFDRITVDQILGEEGFLGTFRYNRGATEGFNRVEVNKFEETDAWFAMPLEGVADGQEIELKDAVFFVAGTRTYTTRLGGPRTVFVLRRVEPKRLDEARERLAQAKLDAEFRTWRDASGKFSVEARFVAFAGGKAKLEKRGGDLVEISTGELSAADRSWIRQELQRRKASLDSSKRPR